MLNKRRKQKLPDYAVQFVGYSAHIIARKENTKLAELDFVSDAAILSANEGYLAVRKRADLSSTVADLPRCIDQLKSLAKSVALDSDGQQFELRGGEVSIGLDPGADIERFVSQIAERYRAIEPILEQAEKLGSEIKRPRYADYIDEIARTGVSRVTSYGVAFFVDGKLAYYPERRTTLVEPTEDDRTFEVRQNGERQ